jgi:AraC-like DNA-binding protein/quercetin dioxygenase-like cupin family protein
MCAGHGGQNGPCQTHNRSKQTPRPSDLKPTQNPDTAARPAVVLDEQHPAGDGAWHSHQRVQFIHASAGVMRVSTAQGHWVVLPQRAVWVPGGVPHAVGSARGYQLHTLYLLPRLAPALAQCAVVPVSPLLGELLKAAANLGLDYPALGPAARLLHVLMEQLPAPSEKVAALHLPDPLDPRLRRLVAPLHRNPADPRSFDVLAAAVGLSARHANRSFLAATGLTPGAWRTQRRLLAALEGLAQGQPVRRVALEVGYADVSSFIAVFKRAFGVTPARYFAASGPD